jgi:AraC-like DNA-binding protein/catechol 2,3-dioxygenase-like lactoylglutathione lyase family enzyme
LGLNRQLRKHLELARDALLLDPTSIRLTRLAEIACVSPFHFHRLYREAFSETPLQTATRLRVEKACDLLASTTLSAIEICVEVGYQSHTSFSAWFLAKTGYTPLEFRKQFAEKQDWRMLGFPLANNISYAMKTKISTITLFVDNQESALAFYTSKLGFEVTADVTIEGGFRWLTVAPPESPVNLVLFPLGAGGGMPEDVTTSLRSVIASGYIGPCVFAIDDCKKLHESMVSKGVRVQEPPHEEPYGMQASYLDDTGNVLVFVQE